VLGIDGDVGDNETFTIILPLPADTIKLWRW
jgi:hypothetical protein